MYLRRQQRRTKGATAIECGLYRVFKQSFRSGFVWNNI